MQDMKVCVFPLTVQVNEWVKKEYGSDYRASVQGEVYHKNPDLPYDTYVGRWFVMGNAVTVMVEPSKVK